jgi:hypothetical protein
MTKAFKIFILCAVFGIVLCAQQPAAAQCAQCSAVVESNSASGDNKTGGLNNGILYLLAMPYIAVAIVGVIWYKKYRRKNVAISMRDEKLHLN